MSKHWCFFFFNYLPTDILIKLCKLGGKQKWFFSGKIFPIIKGNYSSFLFHPEKYYLIFRKELT